MKRVLILLPLPKNTTDEFIIKGLAKGFEINKCKVMLKKLDEITLEDLKIFTPDLILGYNSSFQDDENFKKIVESSNCKKLAFYFIDEPSGELILDENLKKLKPKIFVADKSFLSKIKNSIYLPLAIYYRKYFTEFSGFNYCITFVGSPTTDFCQQTLCDLIKVFKNKVHIFSCEKDFSKSIKEIKAKGLLEKDDLKIYSKCRCELVESEQEFAEIYNSSKINLNISPQGSPRGNYHILEVLASSGFLLTNEIKDLSETFKISKHLETFKNSNDLIDKIDFYLKNLNIAQIIAQLGKFEVIDSHAAGARARRILNAAAI